MASSEAAVSVVMATYNGGRYLEAQLDSIVEQLSPGDELIILDDQSSDKTIEIIARYTRAHDNIRLIVNSRNLGVRATFELLLQESRCDFIMLSDQDDIWLPGRKRKMLLALAEQGVVAVLANANILTANGIERTFFPVDEQPNLDSISANLIRNRFIGCCMAMRREVLRIALPFPRLISMHDWWLGSCAMALGRVSYLGEPALLYRRHDSNQSAARRRAWWIVARDRFGNVLALTTLFLRLVRLRVEA